MTLMVKWNGAGMLHSAARVSVALALLASAAGASAQLYSWKDDKGVTHFSDQPPPEPAAKAKAKGAKAPAVAIKDVARGGASAPDLPYELGLAVRRNPVVLYSTAACPACDSGRTLLQQRGIPFSEKIVTANDDQQQLKAVGVGNSFPVLAVGATRKAGFDMAAWQDALTAASYPAQSRLPANYRQAPATAAAPVPQAPLRDVAAQPAPSDEPARKPPPQNAPPGFQF